VVAVHPFKSSLNGLSAGRGREGSYTQATGRQWTQPIGFVHALFEVASMSWAGSRCSDGDAVAEAIAATNLDTIVGPIAFNGAGLPPFAARNVCKTPLVGGQWRLKDGGGYDLVIVDNPTSRRSRPAARWKRSR
jgi:branched-chain amino acid transport system substrate-binding protein